MFKGMLWTYGILPYGNVLRVAGWPDLVGRPARGPEGPMTDAPPPAPSKTGSFSGPIRSPCAVFYEFSNVTDLFSFFLIFFVPPQAQARKIRGKKIKKGP